MTSAKTTARDWFEPETGTLPVEPTPTYDELIAELAAGADENPAETPS